MGFCLEAHDTKDPCMVGLPLIDKVTILEVLNERSLV